jgi:hypothetical protein
MLGYNNLGNFYKTNFALMQHHKYSLQDLESMIPWERYLYIDMLKEHIKEQNEKSRDQAAAATARRRSNR